VKPLDPDTWVAPEPLLHGSARGIRGTLYGSQLYDQPTHRAAGEAVRAFCSGDGPLAIELGVDKGYRIMAHARRWPSARWLGIELRRRIEPSIPEAPDNCLLLKGDGRAVLSALVPDGRVDRLDILFPTPSDNPRHLLITPQLVQVLERVMTPEGVVYLATDVPGFRPLVARCFAAWRQGEIPLSGPVRSRREKVCEREGRPVWRFAFLPPADGEDRSRR